MSNIRKNFLENNIFKKILNSSFWFEDKDLNVAEKEIIIENSIEDNKREAYEKKIRDDYEMTLELEKNTKRIDSEIEEINKTKEIYEVKDITEIISKPNGYIDLYLININVDELFLKHNITLQYLDINGGKYIKEIKLSNQGRELDCFADGENKSLTMEKISSTQLLITLEESSGNVEKIIIINGKIIN